MNSKNVTKMATVIYHHHCCDSKIGAWIYWFSLPYDIQYKLDLIWDKQNTCAAWKKAASQNLPVIMGLKINEKPNMQFIQDRTVYLMGMWYTVDILTEISAVAKNVVVLGYINKSDIEVLSKLNIQIYYPCQNITDAAWKYFKTDYDFCPDFIQAISCISFSKCIPLKPNLNFNKLDILAFKNPFVKINTYDYIALPV
jgi:hypothetical protein